MAMEKRAAPWIPELITLDQKCTRYKISCENLILFEAEPVKILQRVVSETWMHHFQPQS